MAFSHSGTHQLLEATSPPKPGAFWGKHPGTRPRLKEVRLSLFGHLGYHKVGKYWEMSSTVIHSETNTKRLTLDWGYWKAECPPWLLSSICPPGVFCAYLILAFLVRWETCKSRLRSIYIVFCTCISAWPSLAGSFLFFSSSFVTDSFFICIIFHAHLK